MPGGQFIYPQTCVFTTGSMLLPRIEHEASSMYSDFNVCTAAVNQRSPRSRDPADDLLMKGNVPHVLSTSPLHQDSQLLASQIMSTHTNKRNHHFSNSMLHDFKFQMETLATYSRCSFMHYSALIRGISRCFFFIFYNCCR
jgi:hypothetical protein